MSGRSCTGTSGDQSFPHRWPLNVVMDTWEELHWRFVEEIKELLRELKKQVGLAEIKFHCLLPGP